MEIRSERSEDIAAVRRVNLAAFDRSGEANLVDRLRGIASTFSFVAVESAQIVGHIFFGPVEILHGESPTNQGECDRNLLILGLAPIAVLPDYQRQGIGSLLIQHSLEKCSRLGCKAIVVLGSPTYYPRFGFIPAKEKGLRCEYKVPDEAFMVLELERDVLNGCIGLVKYRSEFNELE
jgi:putative acetyltransferase